MLLADVTNPVLNLSPVLLTRDAMLSQTVQRVSINIDLEDVPGSGVVVDRGISIVDESDEEEQVMVATQDLLGELAGSLTAAGLCDRDGEILDQVIGSAHRDWTDE